jgi:tRNA(fMet)-specific endonuclease VapC
MTRYLLGTNHASGFWSQDANLRARMVQAADAEYFLCTPSIAELWFMVFNSSRVEHNRARLELMLQQFPILDFDETAAETYGVLWTNLRRRGRPIPVIDAQIAAIALSHELVLLTADVRHFAEVDGLVFENWLSA